MPLGAFWLGRFGSLLAVLGALGRPGCLGGASWGRSGSSRGPPGGLLGPCWGHLRATLGPLGASWVPLGTI
eukprot:943663-Pyramimonas_sp.AAC.1